MKRSKRFFSFALSLIMVLSLCAFSPVSAFAAGVTTSGGGAGTAAFAAELQFPDNRSMNKICIGDTFQINMVITQNDGVVMWRTELQYDQSALQLVSVQFKGASGELEKNSNLGTCPYPMIWNDAYSQNNTETGTVVTFEFRLLAAAVAGRTYSIALENSKASDTNDQEVPFTSSAASVQANAFHYGDVDNNGIVTIDDVIYLMKYIVRESGYTTIPIPESADVDGNTGIDGRDAVAILRHIANWKRYRILPLASSFEIQNLRFETHSNGVPFITWDASARTDVTFKVFGDTTAQYSCGLGGTKSCEMPAFTTMPGRTITGFRVEAYDAQGTMLASVENPAMKLISADAAAGQTDVVVSVAQDSTNNGLYQVSVSGLNDYQIIGIFFCADNTGNDSIGDFIPTDGKDRVTPNFRDDGTRCMNGYYTIYSGKNYVMSDNNNTVTFDCACLADWTHTHRWVKSISAATWLLPEESTCSVCGELRIDAPCLRDVAQNTYTVTSTQGNSFTLRNGTEAYFLFNTYRDAANIVIYTERIICRQSDNRPLEYDCWYGDNLSNQQLFYGAELYEWTNDSVLYRQVAEFSHNTEYRISKKIYYQMNGDGTYTLLYRYDNYAYDAAGNMLEYKQYEANGHHAWTYTYSYYPSGVLESSKMLDPDNNNSCWGAWYYTAEGKEWKHEYVTDAGMQTEYFNGYSATNPYVYISLKDEYTALSAAEQSIAYSIYDWSGTAITVAANDAIHMKDDGINLSFAVSSGGTKPNRIALFPTGYQGTEDNGASSWCGTIETVSNNDGTWTTYFVVPKSHIADHNGMCKDTNRWVLNIMGATGNELVLIIDSGNL